MIVEFMRILLWEAVQNLPPMAGFGVTAKSWILGRRRLAGACALLCAVAGSLLIELTEPLIRGEPVGRILTFGFVVNTLVFGLFSLLGMLYLRPQRKYGWDVAVGFGMALGLTALQSLAVPTVLLSALAHIVALGLAFSVVLLSMRWVVAGANLWRALLRAVGVTMAASVLIVIFDYGHRVIP